MSTNEDARREMIEALQSRGVDNAGVLDVMSRVPRELFVARNRVQCAYHGAAVAGEGRWNISQPYTVAILVSALDPVPSERALLVGTGSGYVAAILANLVREVYAVEIAGRVARLAASRLRRLGLRNVVVRHGDGSLGWPEHELYDAILVAAAAPGIPEHLIRQLAAAGRLVIPVGRPLPSRQRLYRVTRGHGGQLRAEELAQVQFSPLVGAEGWKPHIIAREARGSSTV